MAKSNSNPLNNIWLPFWELERDWRELAKSLSSKNKRDLEKDLAVISAAAEPIIAFISEHGKSDAEKEALVASLVVVCQTGGAASRARQKEIRSCRAALARISKDRHNEDIDQIVLRYAEAHWTKKPGRRDKLHATAAAIT